MELPISELVGEFVKEVSVRATEGDGDVFLEGLVDHFQLSAAMFKRDTRRMLEKDPASSLQSACRVLKGSSGGPGAEYLMEQLWSNPVLVGALIDPELLPLSVAIGFAKRWMQHDSLLDIKLLHLGFPSDATMVHAIDLVRAKRVLAIVNELPARRHILLPLANLLHSPDPKVRSKAASLYGRTSRNPDWVRKKLGETDARVRANAVESLWGNDSAAAAAVLREAMRDPHHRVMANALIGLHHMGGYDVTGDLKQMASGEDAMGRAAAAYAMGQVLSADLKPLLERMLKDANPQVRSQALRSLIQLKRRPRAETLPAPDSVEPADVPDGVVGQPEATAGPIPVGPPASADKEGKE
jgi:hypothetical protein